MLAPVPKEDPVPKRSTMGLPLLRTLSRPGLDFRPLARRFRDTSLRAHRADTINGLARLEAAQTALRQATETALDKLSSECADDRSQAQAANWAMQDRLSRLEQHVADLHAEDVQRTARF